MSMLPIVAPEAAPPCPSRASDNAAGDPSIGELSLVELLLREQQDLSAVERFAQHHAGNGSRTGEQFYRSLMPASEPGPGQQYAFEVDLDRCSGCKACVTACHTLNGLDENETWRDVGLLLGGTRSAPALQHVTTACHHCLEPACLTACPVNAYEKDPLTGIVKHLDDQCFGCQYCTLACPYDVPKYHAAKGIVRKCDLCSARLAVGEPPACVQACPHQAISVRVVDVAEVRDDAEAAVFLPAAPDPRVTFPTTTYKTRRVFPRNMLPADYFEVSPQHAHWPLVVMLVLTQLSVGAFAAGLVLEQVLDPALARLVRPLQGITALLFGLVALAGSTLHLGRPQYAYRALLGLRHSWMSREILAFGMFAALASAYSVVSVLPAFDLPRLSKVPPVLGVGVVATGGVAVLTSVMIYSTLGREYWSVSRTAARFFLTVALLGTATVWLSISLLAITRPSTETDALLETVGKLACLAIAAIAAAKLLWEAAILRHLLSRSMTQLKRSARLMTNQLASATLVRFTTGVLGGIAIPIVLSAQLADGAAHSDRVTLAVLTSLLFLACLAGELGERYLFFAAVAAPRMPGSIR